MSILGLYGTFLAKLAGVLCATFSVLLLGLPIVRAVWPDAANRGAAWLWAVAVGLTVYGTALTLLGFAGVYDPLTCALLLLPGPLLNLRRGGEIAAILRGARASIEARVADLPAILVTAATAAMILPAVIAPEIFYDALYYHLGLPAQYLLAGRVSAPPDVVHAAFPATLDLVFGAAAALGGTAAAKGLGFILYLLAIAATAGLSRCMDESHRGGAPWASAAILASVPGIAIMATLTSVDVGMAFAAAMAWIALVESRRVAPKDAWRPVILAAFPIGLVAGSKYTGLYLLASFVPLVLSGPEGTPFRSRLLSACAVASAALLVCSPWYLRNLVVYGNPVYPALAGLFAGGEAGAYAMERLASDLPRFGPGDVPALFRALARGDLGAGGDLGVLLPAAFLAMLAAGITRWRMIPVIAAVLVYIALWSAGPKAVRYLFPVFPVLAAGGGAALAWLSARGRGWRMTAAGLLLAGAAFNCSRLAGLERFLFNPRGELASLLKADISPEGYMDKMLPQAAMARWANANLPKDAVVLFVGETRPLYFERKVVFASAYDRPRLIGWIAESGDGDILARRIRREGITHILVNGPELARLQKRYGYMMLPEAEMLKVRAFLGKVGLLHAEGGIRLAAVP